MRRFSAVLASVLLFSLVSSTPVVNHHKARLGESHAKTKTQNLPLQPFEEPSLTASQTDPKRDGIQTHHKSSQPEQATKELQNNPQNSGTSTQTERNKLPEKDSEKSQLKNDNHSNVTESSNSSVDPVKSNRTVEITKAQNNTKVLASTHKPEESTKNKDGQQMKNKQLNCYLELYEIANILVKELNSMDDSSPNKIKGDNYTIYSHLLKLMMKIIERKQSSNSSTIEPGKPTNHAVIKAGLKRPTHQSKDTEKKLNDAEDSAPTDKKVAYRQQTGNLNRGTTQDQDSKVNEPAQKQNEKSLNLADQSNKTSSIGSKMLKKNPQESSDSNEKKASSPPSEKVTEEVKTKQSNTPVEQTPNTKTKTRTTDANSDSKQAEMAKDGVETNKPTRASKVKKVSSSNSNSSGEQGKKETTMATLTENIHQHLNSNAGKTEEAVVDHKTAIDSTRKIATADLARGRTQHSVPHIHRDNSKRQNDYKISNLMPAWDW